MKPSYPYYLANRPVQANSDLVVTNKYTGQAATRVSLANPVVIDQAIERGVAAVPACRKMPAHLRSAILHQVANRMKEGLEELARVLAEECGKPIRDARGEVTRGIETFRLAAEEATRLYGEYLPLDASPRCEGYEAIAKRFPIGLCSFISPFNFPINLAAHKIAPAIAAGCPFVLKPASYTPVSALLLGEMLAETDLPVGAFSILPCRRDDADLFATDFRFKLLSFTGSPKVGWELKTKAGKKPVILELGGNAACVVDRDIDQAFAVSRLMIGAFYQSGQSCISVQRIFIHDSIYEEFKAKLVSAAAELKSGDPLSEDTFLGPLISEQEAVRVESWINKAVVGGARLVCGGKRNGAFVDATFLEDVPDTCELGCCEVFGPVACLERFSSIEKVCDRVNASAFGLQAGVFTRNLDAAFYAFNELEVGGVVINDVPSFRADAMPYGGVKESGLGREGVRYAIGHMTETRLMILNKVGRR